MYGKLSQTNSQESLEHTFDKLIKLEHQLRPKASMFEDDGAEIYLYHDWAKLILLLLDQDREWNSSNQTDLELVFQVEHIFEITMSSKLQLQALSHICSLLSTKPLENQRMAEKGLNLAYECGLEKQKLAYEKLLRQIEQDILFMYQNRFVVLYSSPIKLKANDSGMPTLRQELRCILIPKLLNSMKELKVEFGILTKAKFVDIHRKNNGCKVLVVDFYKVNKDILYLEDDMLGLVPFTIEDLSLLPHQLGDSFGSVVDIVIILCEDAEKVIPFFDLLSVKQFVYFTTTGIERVIEDSDEIDLLLLYWLQELRHTFLGLFFEYLTSKAAKDTHSCLKLVQAECIDSVNHRIKDCKYYRSQINHWKTDSLLVEKDLVFSEENIQILTIEDLGMSSVPDYSIGKLEELSSDGWKRAELPEVYITRDQAVLDIFHLLTQSGNFRVNLWGEFGVGKTFIAKMLEYELSIRDLYPHGIYYFDLKQMDQVPSIRKQMSLTLGFDFLVDTSDFFKRNDKCLIILDGYEKIITGGLQDPVTLLSALSTNRIHTIFITEAEDGYRMREVPDTETYKIERLSDNQSLQFLLSTTALKFNTYLTFSRDSIGKFAHSTMIKDCKGLPYVLSKNLKRIFIKGLGIKLDSSKLTISKSNSMNSPQFYHNSPRHMDSYSDMEDDLRSHPSVYNIDTISMGYSMRDSSKRLPMAKTKSKIDSKKDSKNLKTKTKKKQKKEMH